MFAMSTGSGARISVESRDGEVMKGGEIAKMCSHDAWITAVMGIENRYWHLIYHPYGSIFYTDRDWFTFRIGNLNVNRWEVYERKR